MILHEDYKNLSGIKNAVVTIGTFDGVHLGHQEILKRIIELSKSIHGESALVTFWPHPRYVLNPDEKQLKLLTTFEEKAAILEKLGLDHLVRVEFTKEFANWSSEQFIQEVIIKALHTKKLVIGYDHRFGKDREGGFDHLKKHSGRYGFSVEEIPKQEIDDVGISSTKIRNGLTQGKVQLARNFLGRYFELTGKVIPGDKIGRTLGFPTANIEVEAWYKLIPGDGTYAVLVNLKNQVYQGMLNIGIRPTVDGKQKRIEVHLIDFEQQIYEEKISIFFIKKLRDEQKFASKEALSQQLQRDKEDARKILSRINTDIVGQF